MLHYRSYENIITIFFLAYLCPTLWANEPLLLQTVTSNNLLLNLIYINLKNPRLNIIPITPLPGESLFKAAQRVSADAAINGAYFMGARDYRPIGDILVDKKTKNSGRLGTAIGINSKNEIEFFLNRIKHKEKLETRYVNVLTAGPRLITTGDVTIAAREEGFSDPRLFQKKRRSALGLIDQEYLILVSTSTPCYFEELAQALQTLGITQAMNLDGGSSTGLFYKDTMIVKPQTSSASTFLAVFVNNSFWWERWKAFIYAN